MALSYGAYLSFFPPVGFPRFAFQAYPRALAPLLKGFRTARVLCFEGLFWTRTLRVSGFIFHRPDDLYAPEDIVDTQSDRAEKDRSSNCM